MNEEMIIKNTNLIYIQLKSLGLYNKRDDYFDVGVIGLIKGVKTFNPDLGYAPSTYLSRCIRSELLQQLRIENNIKNKANINPISLNKVIYYDEGKSITLEDMIESDINIEEKIVYKNQRELLYEKFKLLSDVEQNVLNHYYGLNGYEKLKQIEIANVLKISQPQVFRIKERAIKKLKSMVKG